MVVVGMGSLEGKIVVITGANGGLGTAVTPAFLKAGAYVAGVSRSIKQADFDHPGFFAIAAELSSQQAAEDVVRAAAEKFKRVDVLVHLLGGFAGGPALGETSAETLDQMLSLNLKTAFYVIKAVIPRMMAQGAGSILAIGSRTAVEPAAGLSAYSASKAALVSLIGTVARENKGAGITANIVLPGTMDTPANRAAMPDADASQWVLPQQVADLLVHLASPAASQISGAVIPVYGGGV